MRVDFRVRAECAETAGFVLSGKSGKEGGGCENRKPLDRCAGEMFAVPRHDGDTEYERGFDEKGVIGIGKQQRVRDRCERRDVRPNTNAGEQKTNLVGGKMKFRTAQDILVFRQNRVADDGVATAVKNRVQHFAGSACWREDARDDHVGVEHG